METPNPGSSPIKPNDVQMEEEEEEMDEQINSYQRKPVNQENNQYPIQLIQDPEEE